MCGRFTLTSSPAKLAEAFDGINPPAELNPRYNVAPTQPVAVVANNGQNQVEFFHWGLIPFWAKDPAIGNRLINARAETVAEKPAFKAAYKRRRCLVLSDGFYEWLHSLTPPKDRATPKTPFHIRLASGEPFAFAGLWESWQSPDETTVLSCTIITTDANELISRIHNRMPVILPPESYAQWLDPAEQAPDRLVGLLKPYPAEAMLAYPVSILVNNPKNDTPDCLAPVADPWRVDGPAA